MSHETALQNAVRDRLVATPSLVALVPSDNIRERNHRPNPQPSIIIGEGQSADEGDTLARTRLRIYLDLHVWVEEKSTAGAKAMVGEIRTALRSRLAPDGNFHVADCRVASARFLRDPDGLTSHAVVTVNAVVEEII